MSNFYSNHTIKRFKNYSYLVGWDSSGFSYALQFIQFVYSLRAYCCCIEIRMNSKIEGKKIQNKQQKQKVCVTLCQKERRRKKKWNDEQNGEKKAKYSYVNTKHTEKCLKKKNENKKKSGIYI